VQLAAPMGSRSLCLVGARERTCIAVPLATAKDNKTSNITSLTYTSVPSFLGQLPKQLLGGCAYAHPHINKRGSPAPQLLRLTPFVHALPGTLALRAWH
jgi:hypothetical protein